MKWYETRLAAITEEGDPEVEVRRGIERDLREALQDSYRAMLSALQDGTHEDRFLAADQLREAAEDANGYYYAAWKLTPEGAADDD